MIQIKSLAVNNAERRLKTVTTVYVEYLNYEDGLIQGYEDGFNEAQEINSCSKSLVEVIKGPVDLQELKEFVYSFQKPPQWREGQFVFNIIDSQLGIARKVQFKDNIDCFYLDKNIDDFLTACLKYINNENIKNN